MVSNIKLHKWYFKDREDPVCLQPYGSSLPYYSRTLSCFAFVGPCIVIYFYSKTNQMHNISNLFYFVTTLYMFRTVSPTSGVCLLAFPPASSHRTCMPHT